MQKIELECQGLPFQGGGTKKPTPSTSVTSSCQFQSIRREGGRAGAAGRFLQCIPAIIYYTLHHSLLMHREVHRKTQFSRYDTCQSPTILT